MGPYIVAEMGANHFNDLKIALLTVDKAAVAGCDAIKIQTWTPGRMVTREDMLLEDGPWKGRSVGNLYREAMLPWDWIPHIFNRAKQNGIDAFSSVFDEPALSYLESAGCPRYKIASFELTDIDLIRRVASTGKPIVLSTGMADAYEIDRAVETARLAGAKKVTVLKCTSAYPADGKEANLRTMLDMRDRYLGGVNVGLSDHTEGLGVAVAAAALGASMIEKHFTAHKGNGLDSAFSIDTSEMAQLVKECRRASQALGEVRYGASEQERPQLALRRSLYYRANLPAGTKIDPDQHLITARPALGLSPHRRESLRGRVLAKDVEMGAPVKEGAFK